MDWSEETQKQSSDALTPLSLFSTERVPPDTFYTTTMHKPDEPDEC